MLPYLEIKKQQEEEHLENIEMPNLTGLTVQEAKKILKDLGVEVEINGEAVQESIVIEQLPKKGIEINTGTKVTIYV